MASYQVARDCVCAGGPKKAGDVVELDSATAAELLGTGQVVEVSAKDRAVKADGETKPAAKKRTSKAKKKA
jgi:hypothetical protein